MVTVSTTTPGAASALAEPEIHRRRRAARTQPGRELRASAGPSAILEDPRD